MIHIYLKNLLEANRRDLLLKQKRETPERIERSKAYSINNLSVDPNAFLNDWLVVTVDINGNGSTYKDSIAFAKILSDLIDNAKIDSTHNVNSKLIQKTLKSSLDKHDIYIDCTCDDFKYRYAYFATQGKFKWGKLQNSNGKKIRNPNNDIGSMCKHLYTLLRSNKFMEHISDKIMRTIMANLDVIVKKYNINLLEFKVNNKSYDRLLNMNLSRDKSGRFIKNKDDVDDKNNSANNEPEESDSNGNEWYI